MGVQVPLSAPSYKSEKASRSGMPFGSSESHHSSCACRFGAGNNKLLGIASADLVYNRLMLRKPKLLWIVLALCVCTAVFAAAYPMYVIRPFRAQGAGELVAALLVRHYGPFFAVAGAAGSILTAALLWRSSPRKSARSAAAIATALAGLSAVFTHVNVFERMFPRIDAPEVVAASEAKIDGGDMVLAIRLGPHARAYPVRMMAYHHIVNDWVNGVPVVGTY